MYKSAKIFCAPKYIQLIFIKHETDNWNNIIDAKMMTILAAMEIHPKENLLALEIPKNLAYDI